MHNALKGIIVLILLFVAILGRSGFLFVSETTKLSSLPAVADAKVRYQAPTTNYGTTTVTTVDRDVSPYDQHWLYMKFDLSTISSPTSFTKASVWVYCEYVSLIGRYEVSYGWSDTWTETGINWNTKPAADMSGVTSWLVDHVGWYEFAVSTEKVSSAFSSDKLITFVLRPDFDFPNENTWSNWRLREYGSGFSPRLDVTYTAQLPTYTLTVQAVDQSNALISDPVSITVSSETGVPIVQGVTTNGKWVTTLEGGTYRLHASYGAQTGDRTITLDMAKSTTFSFTTTPTIPTGQQYTLTVNVKDQLGHPLPALVLFDTTSTTADTTGKALYTITGSKTINVKASVQVGARTFETSTSVLIDSTKTETITINRRFWMRFFFNYTDGTRPSGTLFLSNKEAISVPITVGEGEAYLLDGNYKLTFAASPAIDLGSLTVNNDADIYAALNKDTLQIVGDVEQTTTTPTTTPSEVPFYLIPGPYIYILMAVLVLLGIVAIALRGRSQRK